MFAAGRRIIMPKLELPPFPRRLCDLEDWAFKAGVGDLLDSHVSQIGEFVDNDITKHRLTMASASGTVREVVVRGKTRKAFLSNEALAGLGRATRTFLVFHARRRLLDNWRADSWHRSLSSPPLTRLAVRLKDMMQVVLGGEEVGRPLFYQKAETEVDEGQDTFRVRFFGVRGDRFGRRPPVICEIDLEDRDQVVGHRCSCDRFLYDDEPCAHLRVSVEWLLDSLYDSGDSHHRSLVQLLCEPRWARVLNALERAVPVENEPDPNERLIWKVGETDEGIIVEPSIQKVSKRGGWSSGRQVSGAALWDLLSTDSVQERQLLRAYMDADSEPDDIDVGFGHFLELLAGHPLVFHLKSPTTRLEVIVESPSVAVRLVGEDELKIGVLLNGTLRSGDKLEDCRVSAVQLVHIDAGAGICSVVGFPKQAAALLHNLSVYSGEGFPVSGLERMLEVLSKYGEWVPVDLDRRLEVEERSTDSQTLLRLRPVGDGGLEASLLVEVESGSRPQKPGEGARSRLVVEEGRVVQLSRNLQLERARADELAGRLGLSPHSVASHAYRMTDPEEALDFLLTLADQGDGIVVQWPEEAKRPGVARADSGSFRVRLESRGRIFGLDGEVEIDGETVPLAEVLAALGRGERWVRLGPGRFARIEANLRKALRAADRVASTDGRGRTTVGAAVAPILGDLLGDEVEVDGDRDYRVLLDRVRAADRREPEVPEELQCELRSYQVDGFRWLSRLASWGAGAILADEMGLGKTLQALAVLLHRARLGPALVVAPTSVCGVWISEARRFAPALNIMHYRGPDRQDRMKNLGIGDVIVASYTVMALDCEYLEKVSFATLVIDEAQFVKNPGTRRARALRRLQADWAVALTGTPLENHLGELWAIFNTVSPGLFGSWSHFRDRFAAPVERHGDKEALKALVDQTRPFLLRRTKNEVAPELPPRTEVVRPVVLKRAERELYEAVRREILDSFVAGSDEDQRFQLLAAITRLRLLACHARLADPASKAPSAKLETALELLDELLESGQRALVFSQFTRHLALVREALERRRVSYLYLDGSTPAAKRSQLVKEWREGGQALFLLSMKAGGTGLNLMGADCVIHLDPWWNPAVEDQATDRTHRIGQTRPVTVVRLISQATIEEAVVELHESKRELARGVLEGAQAAATLSTDELVDLIRLGGGAEGHIVGDEEEESASSPTGFGTLPVAESVTSNDTSPGALDLADLERLTKGLQFALKHELANGKIASSGTVQIYTRAAMRLLDYAGSQLERGTPPKPLAEWTECYLEALADGSYKAPKSEATIARTVLNRLKRLQKSSG